MYERKEKDKEGNADAGKKLRSGFSTGACAAAAGTAALGGLLTGEFAKDVAITLPRGERVKFAIERGGSLRNGAYAVVRKDAGDDPDVTHGALILVAIEPLSTLEEGAKVNAKVNYSADWTSIDGEDELALQFCAGAGVGVVTLAGLPLAVGEPAINPAPRKLMATSLLALLRATREGNYDKDSYRRLRVTIAVANGVRLAERTWNGRLGIVGGLSILGTTGIVVPYSCSAWIHSIHRGIDVARANATSSLGAATGRTSEATLMRLLGLSASSIIDMGDFVGGMLKYMRKHPVACLTIGGGFAKMVKLAQGNSDLHSGRSQVDFASLASLARTECAAASVLCAAIADARSANEVLSMLEDSATATISVREKLLRTLASKARDTACSLLAPTILPVGIVLVARDGRLLTHLKAH